MRIEDTEVYALERSKKSAGLSHGDGKTVPSRISIIGTALGGSGHDCFLKGIIVAARITASHGFLLQWDRYNFHDISTYVVSSSSKMHSILDMDPTFRPETSLRAIDEFLHERDSLKTLIALHPELRKEAEVCLSMSCPIGLELTIEIRTNYLQLKNNVRQRENHKMEEWHQYCDWAMKLPEFKKLTQKEKK